MHKLPFNEKIEICFYSQRLKRRQKGRIYFVISKVTGKGHFGRFLVRWSKKIEESKFYWFHKLRANSCLASINKTEQKYNNKHKHKFLLLQYKNIIRSKGDFTKTNEKLYQYCRNEKNNHECSWKTVMKNNHKSIKLYKNKQAVKFKT